MPDPTVPLTADDLTDKVAELIGRTYCPRKGCNGCTDWGRPTARAVLDLLASLAGTDRAGLAARLAPPPGWFLDRDGHGTRALWLDHPDSPDDPWPLMLAAEHAGQEPLWDWLATIVPTRTEGDASDD